MPGSARCSSTHCRPTPAARSASWTTTTGARPRPARPTRRSGICSVGRCSTSASPGMKQAMQNATPQDVERIRQMLDDLNALLENHAAGQDTQEQFARVHARKHGEFFPENPQNTDELIDLLAAAVGRGPADAQLDDRPSSGRSSMELSQQAFGDPRLAQALAQLDAAAAGAAARGGLDVPRAASAATTRWAWARPPGRWRSWAGWTRWPSSSPSPTPVRGWRTSTSTSWRRRSASRPGSTPARWRSWSASCARQGLFERAPDGSLRLSPKALRRLGESALRDVVDRIGGRRGERETRRSGAAGEPSGATRPWAFGDTESWDVPRTLTERRSCAAPPETPARLDVTDVEIVETEQRDPRGGSAVRRHVVVDGAGRTLGADEAHGTGAAPADLHPVPRRRPRS